MEKDMASHRSEIDSGKRFAFGDNWARFLSGLNEQRICSAEDSIKEVLSVETLAGKTFLDAGSGSGIFSLAARRLGARVHSFDYDPRSVACTQEMKDRYFHNDSDWEIEEGSVLDKAFLDRLGAYDIAYSWGVLHHTGAMWQALDNVAPKVRKGGKLCLAIYNDQGRTSRHWLAVKKAYNALPASLKWMVLTPAFVRLWGPTTIKDTLAGAPLRTWHAYTNSNSRGMSPWYDVVDWVGGLPFEVAKPEEIFDFYRERGFQLDRLTTCAGGIGCNEFVFSRHE